MGISRYRRKFPSLLLGLLLCVILILLYIKWPSCQCAQRVKQDCLMIREEAISDDKHLDQAEASLGYSSRPLQGTKPVLSGLKELPVQRKHARLNDSISDSTPTAIAHHAAEIMRKLQTFPDDEFLALDKSFFVPRDTEVSSFVPHWLLQPTPCPANGPFLLVVIPSVDHLPDRRQAIRETWASPAYGQPWPGHPKLSEGTVKVVFFMGLSGEANVKAGEELAREGSNVQIAQEAEMYDDIVLADFKDSYYNLSLKMFTVLQWSSTFCPGARHVFKADEDTFVHLPVLLKVLQGLQAGKRTRFVLGRGFQFPTENAKPKVKRYGRWRITIDEYPFPFFPRYMYGHSYVISGDAVEVLRQTSRHMPVVPNEDAYVTGILAKAANVSRIRSDHFAFRTPPGTKINLCPLAKGRVVSETSFNTRSKIHNMWELIKSGNCSREYLS